MMAQYPDVFIMTFSIHIPNFVLLSQSAQLLLIFCYAAPLTWLQSLIILLYIAIYIYIYIGSYELAISYYYIRSYSYVYI